MKSIMIAGGSCAGLAAARELRKRGFTGTLRVIDRDVHGSYRRPEVSKGLLSGTYDPTSIAIGWPEELGAEVLFGSSLVGLHVAEREVEVRHGGGAAERAGFDGLVVATGCEARPVPFLSPEGAAIGKVHALRNLSDSLAMRPDLHAARDVVIVGGGFIGLEVAATARSIGKRVSVVEALKVPLTRALGDELGRHLAALHRTHGVDLHTGSTVSELVTGASGDVTAVRLTDGTDLAADLVLVAIGSTPGVGWLEESGLALEQGVECDETCAVLGVDGIVAAGDVASWVNPLYNRRMRVEHWTNAIEQGAYAARRLLGVHDPGGFVSAPYFWSDQFGLKIQSVGSTLEHDEAVVLDRGKDHLLMAFGREGRTIAVAGINTGTAVMKLRRHVLDGAPLAGLADGRLSSVQG